MDKSALIEKIKKILAKTEARGATPAEAATALAVAQKLMAENGLFMSDIEGTSNEVTEISESFGTKSVSQYQWVLASELAKHFACEVVVRHTYVRPIWPQALGRPTKCESVQRLIFIGEQVRVEAFKECFAFAYNTYQKSYKAFAKKVEKDQEPFCYYGKPTRDDKLQQRWNYFMGFVAGLTNELVRSENENALVIVKSEALDSYMNSLKIERTQVNYRQAQLGDARDEGYKDGAFAFRNKNKALENQESY